MFYGYLIGSKMPLTQLKRSQVEHVSNRTGHVLINFTGCTAALKNNTDAYYFPIGTATGTIGDLTQWPYGATPGYNQVVTNVTGAFNYRLKENNIVGQVHRWRLQVEATGSTVANAIGCYIINDDSAYRLYAYSRIPAGVPSTSSAKMTFEFTSIADAKSLDPGKGYRIGVFCTQLDANLVLELKSILRVSEAVETKAC